MASSKKKRRRIIVDGQRYYWVASGNDGWIDLRVMADVQQGQQLACMFDYHHRQFVITPYIVRQVIEYGLAHDWKPLEPESELRLGHLDGKIELRLDESRVKAPSLVREEPALDDREASLRWFENYCDVLDNGSVLADRKPGVRYACPCCGFRTLTTRGGFEICSVCFWEDDGQGDHDADVVRGGPNGRLSLAVARQNYADFGACERSALPHVRPPTAEET